MRVAARTLSRAAICAVAISSITLGSQRVAADDSAAHALAEKFSRAGDAERAAAAKKAETQKKAEAEKARAADTSRRKAAEQRAADEAEMLQRAQAEAEARQKADQRTADEQIRVEAEREAARAEAGRLAEEAEQARAEDQRRAEEARQAEAARLAREVDEKRQAEEARQAEAARIAKEAEEKRLAEEQRRAEEARQAEAARIAKEADEQRRAEEARQAEVARIAKESAIARQAEAARIAREVEEKRKAEIQRAARLAKEAEEKRRAEALRAAEEARRAQEARAALEARRTEEAQQIADQFRRAREAREREAAAREHAVEPRNSLGGPPSVAERPGAPWSGAQDDEQASFLPTRVTVLLVMDPRHRAFAAHPPRANPVLCIGEGCYISRGAETAAAYMRRWTALGPANSIGRRAGPCRNHLTCIFRDVELGGGSASIQPVDMGLLRHDRREVRRVRPDRTCDVRNGRLYCAAPVIARGYRAWIVPEFVAARAGASALEEALDDGLPPARSAAIDPWRSWVHAEERPR